jgi:hypothetical protein
MFRLTCFFFNSTAVPIGVATNSHSAEHFAEVPMGDSRGLTTAGGTTPPELAA